ncbi:unnamed protein product [Caenorhabditis auriculariae]|uniref:Transmembrane protein 39A n=1 Tax=Caenorhabditis auriculariae TaxID=2777116 RepID=A0A8S1H687_9PELO|nr:unnamed protein product [Caenorhabditis auriculariae]
MPPRGPRKNAVLEKTSTNSQMNIHSNQISATMSGVTVSIHPNWPDMQFTQGELFFECTLFLYSVLALFLQYLNIYKTLWWLPKSYWHYSLKFHLINPYFLSCVGLLLGWRVTMCFWKKISEIVATLSANRSSFVQSTLMVIEYAIIKTPLMTLIVTSFLFSFSRVCNDFPSRSIMYFFCPFIFYIGFFRCEIWWRLMRLRTHLSVYLAGAIDITTLFERLLDPLPTQIDLDSVLHMCSDKPEQIRAEVDVLITDCVLRVKRSLFAGISTALLSILLPCVFVPYKTSLGVPQSILINDFWEYQLGMVVGLTAFSLYFTYLLPLNYLDLLHRSAVHLGTWQQVEGPKVGQTGSANWAPQKWYSFCLYNDGEVVQMPDGRCYRARASEIVGTVAANPEDSQHFNFFMACQRPSTLINIMCFFEFMLIFTQFWMLVLTNDWQHIVTFVLLMFANYLLFAKLFKDKIILGRIYEPSQEDLLLIQQLQDGLNQNLAASAAAAR